MEFDVGENCSGRGFHWDWYQATIPRLDIQYSNYQQIIEEFRLLGEPIDAKPRLGYDKAMQCGNTVILSGGVQDSYGSHVIVQGGQECHLTVEKVLRNKFPNHLPSRMDVAFDVIKDNAWEELLAAALSVAKEKRITSSTVGDWITGQRGRTLYLGSKTSTHRVRLYEKGKEQREKRLIPDASTDWVRFEVQVRPPKKIRPIASRMSPDQVAVSADWTEKVVSLFQPTISKSTRMTTPYLIQDIPRAVQFMLGQYAKTLKRAVDDGFYEKHVLTRAVSKTIDTGVFNAKWLLSDNFDDVPF